MSTLLGDRDMLCGGGGGTSPSPSPSRYELRCVVWNTRDVDLRDTNVAGQRMSDIYVTG